MLISAKSSAGVVFFAILRSLYWKMVLYHSGIPRSILFSQAWVRLQSTGGGQSHTVLISLMVSEENLRLGAVRGVRCIYQ
jgi:hypothetical protein